jgi:hypothetical protein
MFVFILAHFYTDVLNYECCVVQFLFQFLHFYLLAQMIHYLLATVCVASCLIVGCCCFLCLIYVYYYSR